MFAGAGYAGYRYLGALPPAEKVKAVAEEAVRIDKEAPKAFLGGDQGFIDLKLSNVEHVNHNTKKFRFELPGKDQISGLAVACEDIRRQEGKTRC